MFRTTSSEAQSGFSLAALIVLLTIISLVIAYTIWIYVSFRGRVERVLFEGPYE